MSETIREVSGFGIVGRIFRCAWSDLHFLHPRLSFVNLLVTFLPSQSFVAARLRSCLYRLAGARIGPRTRIYGKIVFSGDRVPTSVRIGQRCIFTTPLFLNASAPIVIGDRTTIGHHVVIITDQHDMRDPLRRCGRRVPLPVTIGDGAWIGARTTILPGVTVGHGSVVAAGAVVTKDVPAHTLAAGVPARILKTLTT